MAHSRIFVHDCRLTPLYPTRSMREVMNLLRFLCDGVLKRKSFSGFELELNRLAVIFSSIPQERTWLHWVNRWGVSLQKENHPLGPVSIGTYFFEHIQNPDLCFKWIDFNFLPLNQTSLSSLYPFSEKRTTLQWAFLRFQKWGRTHLSSNFHSRFTESQNSKKIKEKQIKKYNQEFQLHESIYKALILYLKHNPMDLKDVLDLFMKEDDEWISLFHQNIRMPSQEVLDFQKTWKNYFHLSALSHQNNELTFQEKQIQVA